LLARGEIAAMVLRPGDGDLFLLLARQVEEALGLGESALDQRGRHTVIDDVEEPDLAAGPADLGGDAAACRRIAGQERREIDDRYLLPRDAPGDQAVREIDGAGDGHG